MASPLLLFVFLCSYSCYIAHGDNDHGFVVVQRKYEPEAVCSASNVNLEPSSATVSMPLVHRHGPCAPSKNSDVPTLSFSETLRHSRARTNYIMSQASKGMGIGMASAPDNAAVTIPTHLGGFVDSLEYVVTMGFGTPPVAQVLLMDTGSDISWVQCTPCNSTRCYPQKDPLFDPSKSSTYAPIVCDTDTCRKLARDHFQNGCTGGGGTQCGYSVEYADGSHTRGVYSNETLTLAPGITVRDFHFGCGHDQRGPNDKYDGLLGLGGAPESLVVQTSSAYGGAFSYCLPALNSQGGFLALGSPPSANTSAFVFTPMRHLPGYATFYMVTLTGISVGGKQLDIPQSAFRGGMIIDSGTIVTELQETPYNALAAAIREAFAAYPMVSSQDFDICYNFTGYSNVTVPRVALTFSGGATIDLDVPNGILVNDCLAFLESGDDDGVGIIGNVNQRTLEVLYDAGRGNVGFRAGAC